MGSVGDSYDNALAESTIGLFKTEGIDFIRPWKSVGQLEGETLKMGELVQYKTPTQQNPIHHAKRSTGELL